MTDNASRVKWNSGHRPARFSLGDTHLVGSAELTFSSDEILDGFARRVSAQGSEPMIIASDQVATADTIDRVALEIETQLKGNSLEANAIVALRCPNGPSFFSGLLAIRRAGLVALLVDSATPDDALASIESSLGVAASLTSSDGWDAQFTVRTHAAASRATLPGTGYIKLTSGSSGTPRGILVASAALAADARALSQTMGLADDDRFLATIPMSHSYGLSILVAPALIGSTVLVDPGRSHPLGEARRSRARVFPTVPSHVQALLGDERLEWPETLDLVITAGEPTGPRLAQEFRERTGQKLHVFYGASESGGITFDRTGDAAERGTVGTPIEGVRVELVTIDGADTITVESSAVATGYHPEAEPRLGDGRYLADDLGRWENDELALSGRTSRWINVRGRKVDPLEVERIIGELSGVDEVVVVRDRPVGETGEAIKAVIATEEALTYMDVRNWCRDRLAAHKTPRHMVFVPRLPRTGRGKLDRPAIDLLTKNSARRQ